MKTKIISIALAVVTMLSAVALFSGCSDGEYPVKVANITIESQPKNIVVLDAPTADILIATGYDRYIVGRSDEVDQQSIAVAPSVGSYENPDTDKIINIRIGYAYCIRSTCTVDYQQNKQHQHSSQYSFQHPKYLPSQNIEQYYSSKHLRIIIIISLLFVYINIYYLSDIYYDRR